MESAMAMWGQAPSPVRLGRRPSSQSFVPYSYLAAGSFSRPDGRGRPSPHEYCRCMLPGTRYYRDSVASTSQPAPSAAPGTKKQDISLYQFFAPGGVLSRKHPAYEFRRGQLQMAQAVEQALEEKHHLIVEAGTGTGKTLAYLLPVIRSGKRVIISTGTKNLQEQLFFKDIPFLEGLLGKLRVCYMKGRNNYLCRQKLYDLTDQPVLNGLQEIEQYRQIAEWGPLTETGDRAELKELPENTQLWPKLDARTDRCIGQKCRQWERCFIT